MMTKPSTLDFVMSRKRKLPEETEQPTKVSKVSHDGHDGHDASSLKQKRLPRVKLNYSLDWKPLTFGFVDLEALKAVINERGLLSKRTWNKSDMHSAANLVKGHAYSYSNSDDDAALFHTFYERYMKEIFKSDYFRAINDPEILIISRFPNQEVQGTPLVNNIPALGFFYPNFNVVRRQVTPGGAGAVIGILPDISNVPTDYYDPNNNNCLLFRADRAIRKVPGLIPPGQNPPVPGSANSIIAFPILDNPFILEFTSAAIRNFFLTFVRADLQARFDPFQGINGFAYSEVTTIGPLSLLTG